MSLLLPVHGFVLAGGQSTRMGRDKAALPFRGMPMVETALGKLTKFCSAVSLAGNRPDLRHLAPVVEERWIGAGPAAGIEAGLQAATQPWALFIPVDVPLVPARLLQRWAAAVIGDAQGCVSYLSAAGWPQSTFCLLHVETCRPVWKHMVAAGERKLGNLFAAIADIYPLRVEDARCFLDVPDQASSTDQVALYFRNLNTAYDLEQAENVAIDAELRCKFDQEDVLDGGR